MTVTIDGDDLHIKERGIPLMNIPAIAAAAWAWALNFARMPADTKADVEQQDNNPTF